MSGARPLSLAAATCLTLLVSGSPALARKGAIRSEKKLESRLKAGDRAVVKKHLAFARSLRKDKAMWEGWLELKFALRLDPKNRSALTLLEEVPPPFPQKLAEGYAKGRVEVAQFAVTTYNELLDRGARGKLTAAQLAPVAERLLYYHRDHAGARKVLGFRGSKGEWLNAREAEIQLRFRRAFEKAPLPKPVETNPFPKLAKALDLELKVYRSRHCWLVGVEGSALPRELETMGKAAEVAYAAIHADLLGVPNSVFGGRRATGKLKPFKPFVLLMLDNKAQHHRFLERVVSNKDLRITGRKLVFVPTYWKPEKVTICDSSAKGKFLREWPAQRMVFQVLRQRFGPRRPTYLHQGVSRYYSAHVSGQAMIRTVPTGSQSRDASEVRAGNYANLRWQARFAVDNFRVDPPATLGLFKTLQSMGRLDNAVATAFVDFMLADEERKAKLAEFLRVADSKKLSVDDAVKLVFGEQTREEIDEAFYKWFPHHY